MKLFFAVLAFLFYVAILASPFLVLGSFAIMVFDVYLPWYQYFFWWGLFLVTAFKPKWTELILNKLMDKTDK